VSGADVVPDFPVADRDPFSKVRSGDYAPVVQDGPDIAFGHVTFNARDVGVAV